MKKAPGFSARGSGGGYLLSHFRSTIGVVRLNFSVRNGKRWIPHAITTLVRFVRLTSLLTARARVSWSVTDGQTRLCIFVLDASLFRALSLPNLRKRYGGFPLSLLAGSTFGFFLIGACAPESVRAISTARLNTSP